MRILLFCLVIAFFTSCNINEQEKVKIKTYFDLETYFKKEAKHLAEKKGPIDKTVIINGKAEQKIISINNWEKELGSFIDADINKASWRGSFQFLTIGDAKIYTSQSEKIPVKKVEVREKDGKVISIKIFVHNINDLYISQDSLSYFPDSLYRIKKSQKIKLMEEKRYEILGRIK